MTNDLKLLHIVQGLQIDSETGFYKIRLEANLACDELE